MKAWKHRDLVEDLANTFYGMRLVFAEPSLDSRWLTGGVTPVPDVLTLEKSYTQCRPTIYECKVSKADFRADMSHGKWMKYLPFCERLYFAVVQGVATRADVPNPAGLMIRGDQGWHCTKAPQASPADGWDKVNVQALLMSGAWTGERLRQLADRLVFQSNGYLSEPALQLGWEVATAVAKIRRGLVVDDGEAAEVARGVAKVLECELPEVLAAGEGVSDDLFAREKLEEEIGLVRDAIGLLCDRWHMKEQPDRRKGVATRLAEAKGT